MKQFVQKQKQYLLSGVSYAIPFIACGGILIAISLGVAQMTGHVSSTNAPDPSQVPVLNFLFKVGAEAFKLLLPILAGYIAYAMAGKPGLVAGFIGGAFAAMPQQVGDRTANAGFLGAILAGIVAGNIVNLIKKLPVHKFLRPIMPILIIPVFSAVAVGGFMLVVNMPIASVMVALGHWLESMQDSSAVVLAMVLGAMIALDMGGPVNKTAFFFGASMIEQGNYAIMGAVGAAICTPPLGMGLATLLQKNLWSQEQQESGIAALGMGMIGITEGAIPFAAAEPLKVIPCIMLGSMTASVVAMLGNVGNHAPHGGPIVMFVVDHRLMYVIAIAAGTVVSALSINFVKRLTQNEGKKE